VAAHPWWVWLLAGILTFAAGVIGAGLGVGVRQAIGLPEDSIGGRGVVQLSSMAGAASAGGLLLRLLARATDGPGEALAAGLRFRWTDIPVGAGCFLLAAPLLACASMLAVAVHTRLVGEPPDPIAHAALRDMIDHQSSAWVWAVVGAAVVGAPLVEEIIYRVLLQSAFRALLRRPWTAIALTASVFALMHRGGEEPVPWHAVALLWCLGVALGVAYERTWRPGVPIVIHAMFNAVNVALAAGFAHKSG
jgi:membrane protease YdiL (CAAX protease family)